MNKECYPFLVYSYFVTNALPCSVFVLNHKLSFNCWLGFIVNYFKLELQTWLQFGPFYTAVSFTSSKPLSSWHERNELCMADCPTRPAESIPGELLLPLLTSASRFISTFTVALHFLIEGRRCARTRGFFRILRNVVLNFMS